MHLYTKALKEDLLFRSEEELNAALNILGLSVIECNVCLLAFALMNNHMHLIFEASQEDAVECYRLIQARLAVSFRREGRQALAQAAVPEAVPIDSLKQLRDEIAYVVRNPFVDRTNVNLFAYKWCSGYLYFNDLLDWLPKGIPADKMSFDQRRAFKHSRDASIDPRLRVLDGTAMPVSFVSYKRAMSFFENARQFVQCVMKNVEAQVEIAKRLGEDFLLDDTELWSIARRICRSQYKVEKPKELASEDRARLIKTLKYDYTASNQQIARCLGLPVSIVNQMFPLSVRK